ncbi:conserved exported protein of unknown function [Candidatus Filomicrobium marinum]|uniref:DUF992 domain-containing protein n=1 Tax=Candidatus Filomicrobium marinum TaxID=1608628 RepID=A0A0D6JFT0_9HYPH|nr:MULTISPECIES: DUF992 domain-containing protein [Filomicrobium]MCV0370320.1 DUF992 domain-containing protein [Filomicrobium sp.]CFX22138.1 conserved exported protein of unknown function [Candidatus Filomicrobium marinum]CPR18873.1 conserved exported protein of unknown function [Candidatus Filomicrobium marinum]
MPATSTIYRIAHDLRNLTACGVAALICSAIAIPVSAQPAKVEVGVLNCHVSGGSGFIFGSTKRLDCRFQRPGADERYIGKISKYGIDIGSTTQSTIAWAVLAPTSKVNRGALSGNYGGVSGEATVGVGVGANALIGGSSQSIVLQPLSVQAQQGLNIAAGIAALELRPAQ